MEFPAPVRAKSQPWPTGNHHCDLFCIWCIFFHTNLSKWLRLIKKTLNLDTRSDLKQFEIEETLQFKRVNGFICYLLLFDLMFLFHARYDGMTLPPQILCGALSFHTRWSNRHTFCPVALATWQSSRCPKKSKLWGVESLVVFCCLHQKIMVSVPWRFIHIYQSCPIFIGINYTVSRTFSSLLLLRYHFFCILSQPKESSKSETPRIARFWSI